jgi:hypothetical protein
MRGNSHVRFLGEGVAVMSLPYPTFPGPAGLLADCFARKKAAVVPSCADAAALRAPWPSRGDARKGYDNDSFILGP